VVVFELMQRVEIVPDAAAEEEGGLVEHKQHVKVKFFGKVFSG
jgi:hypothetical protein